MLRYDHLECTTRRHRLCVALRHVPYDASFKQWSDPFVAYASFTLEKAAKKGSRFGWCLA